VCWGVADWYAGLRTAQRQLSAYWMAAACVAVLLVLGIVAHRQVGYWKNSETLWTHTLQVTSGNYQAEDNLASALMERGQYEQALWHLRRAEAIDPFYPLTPFHLGLCEQQLGNLPAATEQYKKAIDLTASDFLMYVRLRHDAFQNMSVAYHYLGDTAKAWEAREIANDLQRRYSW
jgi:protein O-mannosyl-transferase